MFNKSMLILVIFSVLMFLFFYARQRSLIYFPNRQTPTLEQYHAQDMRIVSLTTEDQLLLNAWYKPAENGHATILYLHGNAGNIGARMPLARQFMHVGLGVLLLEYRGYGGNPGSPSEQGLYKDGRAGMRFLQEQGVNSKKIALFGESLGTGVATEIGMEIPVCAMVLQSPYTSMADLASYHYPWIMVKPWDKYDSLQKIERINAPLLILHGKLDQVVPYSQGLRLFHQAKAPKEIVSFDHTDHHNLWSQENYSEVIVRFIDKYC
jgi:fermentation-respiration switch protein FrsA (DUF1100 family)